MSAKQIEISLILWYNFMMQENKNTNQELTFISSMSEPAVPVEQKAPIELPVNTTQSELPVKNFVEEKISVQPVFYAGFWKRVAILYLDTLFSPLFLINIILYFAKGKTIGDFIMQTKLVDELDYKKPGFGKLIGRYLAKILSSFALNIGFLCVGWRKSKTAWHDSLSGTRYVETKQYSGAITWIVNLILFFGIPYFAYSTPIIQNNIGTVMNLFESTLNDSVENSEFEIEDEVIEIKAEDEKLDLEEKKIEKEKIVGSASIEKKEDVIINQEFIAESKDESIEIETFDKETNQTEPSEIENDNSEEEGAETNIFAKPTPTPVQKKGVRRIK